MADKGGICLEYEGKKLRHELKFYINNSTYSILRERLQLIASKDPNMASEDGYLTSSLYFDDYNHSALSDKIAGTRFRNKYRIRTYNHDNKIIKLECKSKYDSYIAKESSNLSLEEYEKLMDDDYAFLLSKKEQTCTELYSQHKLKLLSPTVIVEYLREAYIANEGNVRLTFDKNLSTSVNGNNLFDKNIVYNNILKDDVMIFEVKFDDYIPTYIKNIISGLPLVKCAISKYVMCKSRKVRFSYYD